MAKCGCNKSKVSGFSLGEIDFGYRIQQAALNTAGGLAAGAINNVLVEKVIGDKMEDPDQVVMLSNILTAAAGGILPDLVPSEYAAYAEDFFAGVRTIAGVNLATNLIPDQWKEKLGIDGIGSVLDLPLFEERIGSDLHSANVAGDLERANVTGTF